MEPKIIQSLIFMLYLKDSQNTILIILKERIMNETLNKKKQFVLRCVYTR